MVIALCFQPLILSTSGCGYTRLTDPDVKD